MSIFRPFEEVQIEKTKSSGSGLWTSSPIWYVCCTSANCLSTLSPATSQHCSTFVIISMERALLLSYLKRGDHQWQLKRCFPACLELVLFLLSFCGTPKLPLRVDNPRKRHDLMSKLFEGLPNNDLGLPLQKSRPPQLFLSHLRPNFYKVEAWKKALVSSRTTIWDVVWHLEFAWKVPTWLPEWKCVLWSDKRKFNLDGPDHFHFDWHNSDLPEKIFFPNMLQVVAE